MTYSIIGRCARTGRLGLGITTFSLAVGGRCEGVAANVGICKTQAFPNRTNDPLAIGLLAQGHLPVRVMAMLAANDSEHDYRQIAIMDREGRIAAHTGSGTRGWSGHRIDGDCVAFGNGLVGPQVLAGLIAGFSARPDEALEHRLMRALEGGRDAGGQGDATGHRPERSAAIKVVDRVDYPEIDVRVDVHATAVEELRRVLEEFKAYEEFYRQRGRDPARAIPQDLFAKQLEARRAGRPS
ncbi:MAG: DUF1028 domain-containing protein [Alphaproteobacteria bacterium]|nr:DUF1028 domain-containing protein [Alphaproteobacteria bacterium]